MVNRRISEYVDWEQFNGDGEDDHGNSAETWEPATRVGIYAYDPGSSAEPREPGHDRVVVEPTVYMPAKTVFGPRDRVTVRGKTYEVEGETRQWRHPNGRSKGNVATLRRVDG